MTEAALVKATDCLLYQCGEGRVRETALYGRLGDLANNWRPEDGRLRAGALRAGRGHAAHPDAHATFRSEPTLKGEQLVIPGCERDRSEVPRQLDSFG